MTTPFISPGPEGIPSQVEQVSTGPGGYDFSRLKPKYFPRKVLRSGGASMFRPNITGTLQFYGTIRGLNTVSLHAQAVQALLPGALVVIHGITGERAVVEAKKAITEMGAIDTGDTRLSIHSRLETTPNSVHTFVGPTTFYSPLIEFGLGPHATYGPRPFMTQAFFAVLDDHLRALAELAQIASGASKRMTGNPYANPVNSHISGLRQYLYTLEKSIGDVVPLGGPAALNKLRGGLINFARSLGDIQAVLGHTVSQRFVRRLEGRVTGRLIGIGSHSIFASRTVGASIGGGQRIYNRFAGRATSRYVQQNNTYGGLIKP